MVDPWYGVKNKEREKEKYDLIKSGHQSNSLHELDSDELVPVIHGGNTRVIEDFMNKKSGNTTLQSMPMPNAEKTSK
ncbi:hypothetical protein, partial [Klebsiella pneumoniae]|uniref:hypothetical protein n=1 Tax=Klebsiella pneumoniae TaxID=573 RepID=UPI003B9835EA